MKVNKQVQGVLLAVAKILREYLTSGKTSITIIETKHSKCSVKHIDGSNINQLEVQ